MEESQYSTGDLVAPLIGLIVGPLIVIFAPQLEKSWLNGSRAPRFLTVVIGVSWTLLGGFGVFAVVSDMWL